jgi:hypothetical protein
MSSWIDKRATFQNRFDELTSRDELNKLIQTLDIDIGDYISTGGLSQDPVNNPKYNLIITNTSRIKDIKQQYASLNSEILNYLKDNAKDTNLSGLLTDSGELQITINRLETIQKDMKVDVESSIARDKLLRSRDTDISRHQLFILDRPVRKGLIPYLWVISVLFIGIGLIILKSTFPVAANSTNISVLSMIMEFLTNKIVFSSLLGSALIVIIFLSLKIAGVFGK